jgi:type I restriction enzyme M protein
MRRAPIRFEHFQGCIDWWGGSKRKGRKETPLAWNLTADEVKARGYNLDIKTPHTIADHHGDPDQLLEVLNSADATAARLRKRLFSGLCVISNLTTRRAKLGLEVSIW